MLDPFVHSLPDWTQRILESGYLAVGTFFVLSGFVLARSYAATSWDRTSLIQYAAARCARVYPVYVLSLAIVSPIIFSQVFRAPPGSPIAAEKLELLTQYGLVLQGWEGTVLVNWNTPAWSLSCELFFYLCFPLAALLLRHIRWPRTLHVLIVILAIPPLLRELGVPSAWKPLLHLGDFLIGIAAAGIFESVCRTRNAAIGRGYWLYVPASATAMVLIVNPEFLNGFCTLTAALRPLNAILLIGLALGGGFPGRALATPLAIDLGKASYSMYILHIPLLWWYKRTALYLSGTISQTTAAMIYITGVVLISGVVCRWVEEPANRLIRHWAKAKLA